MPQSTNLMSRMRHKLQNLAYSNRLYQLMLSGPVPKALLYVPNDPWPGDASAGQNVAEGVFSYAGQRFSAHPPQWQPEGASTGWLHKIHGFSWLRDLRALGGDTARRLARSLLAAWQDHYAGWAALVWEPLLIAERLTHLIGFHDFVLASADSDFRARCFETMVRQHRHLQRLIPTIIEMPDGNFDREEQTQSRIIKPAIPDGFEKIRLIRGLVFAGLALPEGEKSLRMGLEFMPSVFHQAILADGCCVERNPSIQIELLRALIDIRHALKTAGLALPPELPVAIDRAAAALRFFRHGDGGLALFNGGREENSVLTDALLTQADTRGRAAKSLSKGGYERLQANRMLVLMDVGVPPPPGLDLAAHAGIGSFELSFGRERVLVNSGNAPSQEANAWHHAMAATAAHSTLTLNDCNSAEILPDGGMGRRPAEIALQRNEQNGFIALSFSHDGYKERFGIIHHRSLTLLDNGDELRGLDRIEIAEAHAGKPFTTLSYALRFHLHPDIQAGLIQNNSAVLMRLPSGSGCRLRVEHGQLQLEESLYYGKNTPRRSRQIVLRGEWETMDGCTLNWFLTREKKSS